MAVETRYARASDGTYVAYQVIGEGSPDIVLVRGWISNIEHEWAEPTLARIDRRLAATGRLIRLDRRGMGLSDRLSPQQLPTIESRLDDFVAVLDAVGARRAVMIGLGHAGGTTLCAMFAAVHPARTAGLVLFHPSARGAWAPDYPWAQTDEQFERYVELVRGSWGTPELAAQWVRGGAPSRADDQALIQWFAEDQRLGGSAEDALALSRIDRETDIREALRSIHVPTLVIARSDAHEDGSRYVADCIPGATYTELAGQDTMALAGDTDAVLREIGTFVDGIPEAAAAEDDDRVLATILFADIVDSTARAVELGDRRWASLLDAERDCLRGLVARFRGREIDTAGDGYFAAFDGPGRAIRCATTAVDAVRELGLEIRVGLHTGECEERAGRLRGVAVHTGARVAALAGSSEVLVSGTVKDLVAGSGFRFGDRGRHRLKGVPGEWPIYAVEP